MATINQLRAVLNLKIKEISTVLQCSFEEAKEIVKFQCFGFIFLKDNKWYINKYDENDNLKYPTDSLPNVEIELLSTEYILQNNPDYFKHCLLRVEVLLENIKV